MNQLPEPGGASAGTRLESRVEVLEGFRTFAAQELADVNTALTEVLKRLAADQKKKARTPEPWSARATAAEWDDLVTWVDWLWEAYGLTVPLPKCWPAHTGAVEELSSMWTAWSTSALKAAEGDGDALNFWHDRVLHPTVTRISSGRYPLKGCIDGHDSRAIARPSTDRSYLPEASRETS